MISRVRLAEWDDLEASDGIFEISHVFGSYWGSLTLSDFALMISNIRITENDDSEACDSMLQFGHRLTRNCVKRVFHCNNFKLSL